MSAGSMSVSPVQLDGVRFHVVTYSTRYGGRVLVTRNPVSGTWHGAHTSAAGRVLCRAVLSDSAAAEAAWFHGGCIPLAVAREVCATL